ncbi:MAG: anti-sigma F factor [Erysipelotrichales bacterium]|nr:anti-sigma F factor [Erysipelotrichales bacterium]
MNEMELRFKANLVNESLARNAIISFVACLNPTLEQISELKTIISEAVSNAIIHGYKLNPERDVIIKASIEKETLTLMIIDYGVGIDDVERARKPSFTTRPDLERAGMGLSIIDSLSDEFDIKSVVGMGTKLFIKKSLSTTKSEIYGNC